VLRVGRAWQYRRLSPATARIAVDEWPDTIAREAVHRAMAGELANLHLATPRRVEEILAHARALPVLALAESAALAAEWNALDFRAWRDQPAPEPPKPPEPTADSADDAHRAPDSEEEEEVDPVPI
jgi:hypothetical protein